MKREILDISENFEFDCGPDYFDDWIIGATCSSYMAKLQESPPRQLRYQFLKGATAIAIEVQGARYDWSHAAKVYSNAGRELGLDVGTMERLLDLAWHWTQAGFRHWTDLVREWVCIGEHRQFYHVRSQQSLTPREFGALFDHLSPVRSRSIVPILLEWGLVQQASFVAIMPAEKPRMHRKGDGGAVLVAAFEREVAVAE